MISLGKSHRDPAIFCVNGFVTVLKELYFLGGRDAFSNQKGNGLLVAFRSLCKWIFR